MLEAFNTPEDELDELLELLLEELEDDELEVLLEEELDELDELLEEELLEELVLPEDEVLEDEELDDELERPEDELLAEELEDVLMKPDDELEDDTCPELLEPLELEPLDASGSALQATNNDIRTTINGIRFINYPWIGLDWIRLYLDSSSHEDGGHVLILLGFMDRWITTFE